MVPPRASTRGGGPARIRRHARRALARAYMRKLQAIRVCAITSSLNTEAPPWYPPVKGHAAVVPMTDGLLQSAIFTIDASVRQLEQEQRTAARQREIEEQKLKVNSYKNFRKEINAN